MAYNRERLRDLIDDRCLITSETGLTLSTGDKSKFYFDCKGVTLHGEGLSLLAEGFLEILAGWNQMPSAIGGLTLGADPIAAAVALKAFERNLSLSDACIVRKEAKKHGTKNKIENDVRPAPTIVVVDDVITTGTSTATACKEFLAAGYSILGIVALVDREAGGAQNLESAFGVRVESLFRKSDFPRLLANDTQQSAERAIA